MSICSSLVVVVVVMDVSSVVVDLTLSLPAYICRQWNS